MLSEQKINENNLAAVKKGSAKIIRLKKAQKGSQKKSENKDGHKETSKPAPPVDQFNSRYFKGRDNDIL